MNVESAIDTAANSLLGSDNPFKYEEALFVTVLDVPSLSNTFIVPAVSTTIE